jgi:uncharacterized membrane protein YkoI
MSSVFHPARLALALALFAAVVPFAAADDGEETFDDDHDQARQAVEQGSVLPLAEILARTRDTVGGDVVGIEFEQQGGHYVYEFKVIMPSGELREVYVDAKSGSVIGSGRD